MSTHRLARHLHNSLRRPCTRHLHTPTRDLVGPPDPVSHMRLVIYDAQPPPPTRTADTNRPTHPYSLTEFAFGSEHVPPLELQFRLQRQQLDAFNHAFWSDSNMRLEAGKAAVLASLPSTSTPLDREEALSEFYRGWLAQEAPRTDAYTAEWRRRNMACIALAASVHWRRITTRVSALFGATRLS